MLLEYGLKNFCSFKEGVRVSFRLDANCPENISRGKNYSSLLCVKGANGSGKTHLLKGLPFIASFAAKSFSYDPEALLFDNFFRNDEVSEFYVEFGINGTEYVYELSAKPEYVEREALYKKEKRTVKIIERIKNEIVYATKPLLHFKSMKLRRNASFISTARQYDWSDLDHVRKFFSEVWSNVGFSGVSEQTLDIKMVSKFLHSAPDYLEFTEKFISECDVGVKAISIVDVEDKESNEKSYYPVFVHNVGGEDLPVTQITESSGTKQLFRQLMVYKAVLDNGGVLILDEFDLYLHPHILPKLLDLFVDEDVNRNGAQLIFSTHNLEIMNSMGRYRTYLVNKRENESFAYRLDEIPGDVLRNDRSISVPYDDGKVGGVPCL